MEGEGLARGPSPRASRVLVRDTYAHTAYNPVYTEGQEGPSSKQVGTTKKGIPLVGNSTCKGPQLAEGES